MCIHKHISSVCSIFYILLLPGFNFRGSICDHLLLPFASKHLSDDGSMSKIWP